MTVPGRLYRLLIRVYPPGPRRAELFDTLQARADARAGHRWPPPGEALNLVAHGLRARLGRPASRSIVLVAALLAISTAALGAAVGGWIAVQTAAPLPSGAEAAALRAAVFPGLPVIGRDGAPRIVPQGDLEGIEYGYAQYEVDHTGETRRVIAYTTAARDRLLAAGWRLTEQHLSDSVDTEGWESSGFTVTRNSLTLRFTDEYDTRHPPWDGDGRPTFIIWRHAPSYLDAAADTGAAVGGVLALLLTFWASRRLERHHTADVVARIPMITYLVVLLPFVPVIGRYPDDQADETAAPFFDVYTGLLPVPQTAVTMAAAILVITFTVDRLHRRPRRP